MPVYWDEATTVVAPDGRTFQVQVVGAWLGTDFDPRVLLLVLPVVLHLVWVALGRAWRVEVMELERRPGRKRSQFAPFIDVAAVTRTSRDAYLHKSAIIDLVLTRGWIEGQTVTYPA